MKVFPLKVQQKKKAGEDNLHPQEGGMLCLRTPDRQSDSIPALTLQLARLHAQSGAIRRSNPASGIAARQGRDASAARRGTRESPPASGGDVQLFRYPNPTLPIPHHPVPPNNNRPNPLTPPSSAATALPDD